MNIASLTFHDFMISKEMQKTKAEIFLKIGLHADLGRE